MSGEKGDKGVARNADGTFAKGSEGGPGRPKKEGPTITEEMKRALSRRVDETDPESETVKVRLVKAMIEKAIEDNDQKAMKMIWHKIDGKPVQQKDITSGGEKIEGNAIKLVNFDDETESQ